jgi:hypothetical protein
MEKGSDMNENGLLSETSSINTNMPARDGLQWKVKWTVEKRMGDWNGAQIDRGEAPKPYEVIEREGNLLMYGGASVLWQCLLGNGTATADQALTYFSNARASIGVGDTNTAAAATQTDLAAATNHKRVGMDSTYPQHTDGLDATEHASVIFRSTFASADANFAWAEWGVFNSVTEHTGRMLNRKVEALGTKASGSTWTFTVTLTLA